MILDHVFMAVPVVARTPKGTATEELYEANPLLQKPPGQKAGATEICSRLPVQAIQGLGVTSLGIKSGDLRDS